MGASVYRITGAGGGAVAVSAEVPAGMAYRVIRRGALQRRADLQRAVLP
jgi:hypothetical protein